MKHQRLVGGIKFEFEAAGILHAAVVFHAGNFADKILGGLGPILFFREDGPSAGGLVIRLGGRRYSPIRLMDPIRRRATVTPAGCAARFRAKHRHRPANKKVNGRNGRRETSAS